MARYPNSLPLEEKQRLIRESAERARAQRKARRSANPQKENARAAIWRAKNPDRVREILKKSRQKHGDAIRAKKRAYAKANREKINTRIRAYYAAHPEKSAQHRATRKATKPHYGTMAMAKRRALKKSGAVGDTKVIDAWMTSWKSKPRANCYWCRQSFPSKTGHADHIVPLSKGGAHSIENLCVACQPCNQRKNARTPEAWNALLPEPVLL